MDISDMEPTKLIQAWLKYEAKRRGKKKVPYRIIAERGKFDPIYISRYVRGRNVPSMEILEKIAAGFGVSLSVFMQGPPVTTIGDLLDNPGMPAPAPSSIQYDEKMLLLGRAMGVLNDLPVDKLRYLLQFAVYLRGHDAPCEPPKDE
jgi:transcriptional regulator with XRE-family HTH domain